MSPNLCPFNVKFSPFSEGEGSPGQVLARPLLNYLAFSSSGLFSGLVYRRGPGEPSQGLSRHSDARPSGDGEIGISEGTENVPYGELKAKWQLLTTPENVNLEEQEAWSSEE